MATDPPHLWVMDTAANIEPLAIKPERAAEMLDCSRSQIYALVKAGRLKAVKMSEGKKAAVRIVTASIYEFISVQPVELPELTPSEIVAGVQSQTKRSSRAW